MVVRAWSHPNSACTTGSGAWLAVRGGSRPALSLLQQSSPHYHSRAEHTSLHSNIVRLQACSRVEQSRICTTTGTHYRQHSQAGPGLVTQQRAPLLLSLSNSNNCKVPGKMTDKEVELQKCFIVQRNILSL